MGNKQNDLIISDIERNEGIDYEPKINPDYPLTEWYNIVRDKSISKLNDSDVSIFIRQGLFLKYIVPEALKRLKRDPTIGELYCGEMMTALYKLSDTFWMESKSLLKEVQNLINELSGGSQIIKNIEWLYEGEEQKFHDKIKLFDEKLRRLELNK